MSAFELREGRFEIALGGARAAFTTRRGGFSRGPYATLNLGRLTGDDPELVRRNRDALASRLGVELRWARQVHGARVIRIGPEPAACPPPEADGQATAARGIGPMALVADCLPVALAAEGAVAMLHVGWRGLAGGVVEAGVRAVRDLAGDGPLAAAIGPGAGGCCYEVGEEVHAHFAPYGDAARRGRNLDLGAVVRAQLQAAGVQTVHNLGLCTICSDPDLFYSHRRDHGDTGRQAGVVWLEASGRSGA